MAEVFSMIEQEQVYLRKVHTLTEDKQMQVKEEFSQILVQQRKSEPIARSGFKRQDSSHSDDMFYDAKEEHSVFFEEAPLGPAIADV
jgi:hypothetical protein